MFPLCFFVKGLPLMVQFVDKLVETFLYGQKKKTIHNYPVAKDEGSVQRH